MQQLHKHNNAEAGQAMLETSVTIFFIFLFLFAVFQFCYYAMAYQYIRSATLDASAAAASSGNPNYADSVMAGRLGFVAKNYHRTLFSQDFQVTYSSSVSGSFEGDTIFMDSCTGSSDQGRFSKIPSCVWTKDNGFVRIQTHFSLPDSLHLLPFGLLSTIDATSVAPISCIPSGQNDDRNMPYCNIP